MQKAKLVLLFLAIVGGGETGIIKRETSNLSSKDELSNHTSAVIESVLQNIHRLKNYEERERLERLVTRFKMLVQELQKNTSPLAEASSDFANNNQENEVNKALSSSSSSSSSWRAFGNAIDGIQNDLASNGKNRPLSVKVLPKVENPNIDKNVEKENKSEFVKSSPTTTLATSTTSNKDQQSTEGNNASGEMDSDDNDDELVQQLRHKSDELDKETRFSTEDEDELITVAEHHSGEAEAESEEDVGGNSQVDEDEENDKNVDELQDDLKLLNKVIGKLRQVKAILKRMRVEEKRRR